MDFAEPCGGFRIDEALLESHKRRRVRGANRGAERRTSVAVEPRGDVHGEDGPAMCIYGGDDCIERRGKRSREPGAEESVYDPALSTVDNAVDVHVQRPGYVHGPERTGLLPDCTVQLRIRRQLIEGAEEKDIDFVTEVLQMAGNDKAVAAVVA